MRVSALANHNDVFALNHHCQVDVTEEKLHVVPGRRLGAEPGWSDRERIDFLSFHLFAYGVLDETDKH